MFRIFKILASAKAFLNTAVRARRSWVSRTNDFQSRLKAPTELYKRLTSTQKVRLSAARPAGVCSPNPFTLGTFSSSFTQTPFRNVPADDKCVSTLRISSNESRSWGILSKKTGTTFVSLLNNPTNRSQYFMKVRKCTVLPGNRINYRRHCLFTYSFLEVNMPSLHSIACSPWAQHLCRCRQDCHARGYQSFP